MAPILHAEVASPCPLCEGIDLQLLPMSPDEPRVGYLHCFDCGHVWTVPNDKRDASLSPPDVRPKIESSQSVPHCPACASILGIWLAETTMDASFDYYRCADCGNISIVPKDTPDAEPSPVALTGDKTPPTGTPK